jgi:hypothetical protein
MNQAGRILAVTAGLMVGGAIFGAVAALAALAIGLAATGQAHALLETDALAAVGSVGAILGGLLFPAAAWLLMRTVPLGLALLGTVTGTTIGGAAGWLLASHDLDRVPQALIGGVIGFVIASILLRIRAGRRSEPRHHVQVG